ncbi:hypothetical protein AB0420_08335 [Streptomyces caelestis]|nr:hypothetical protein [Streptomyces sp. NRRL F-2305]
MPGDGGGLRPLRWWQLSLRSLFWLHPDTADGHTRTYAVGVRHWARLDDGKIRARLFQDARHVAEAKPPAVFPIEGGVIEVATSNFGKRCRHCPTAGQPHQLTPVRPRPRDGEPASAPTTRR